MHSPFALLGDDIPNLLAGFGITAIGLSQTVLVILASFDRGEEDASGKNIWIAGLGAILVFLSVPVLASPHYFIGEVFETLIVAISVSLGSIGILLGVGGVYWVASAAETRLQR